MEGLTFGRIVHYVGMASGKEYPMIITTVKDKQNGIVNGQVFLDDTVYFAQDVIYSHQDEPLPNSWHWIERV